MIRKVYRQDICLVFFIQELLYIWEHKTKKDLILIHTSGIPCVLKGQSRKLYINLIIQTLHLIFQGGMCSVFLPEEERVVNILGEHLEPVTPAQFDRVKVSSIFP